MSQSVGTTLMEIVKRIRDVNHGTKDYPIPASDTMYRKHMGDIVKDEKQLLEYLKVLAEAHYLFEISMVEPDDTLMISGIDGYVVADIPSLKVLRERADNDLETVYEQQFYRRRQVTTIVRELLPQARNFNNTDLGRALNIAVMLQQFEQLLTTTFAEYTDTWKRRKLEELVPDLGLQDEPVDGGGGAPIEDPAAPPGMDDDHLDHPPDSHPKRAVDSGELARIQEMDRSGNWGNAVDRYGVQFLLRIHFRKYEFDKVKWLLRTGKVAREEDLRFVRNTIRTMEERTHLDMKLLKFDKEMAEVKRIAQMKLNQIHQVRKGDE